MSPNMFRRELWKELKAMYSIRGLWVFQGSIQRMLLSWRGPAVNRRSVDWSLDVPYNRIIVFDVPDRNVETVQYILFNCPALSRKRVMSLRALLSGGQIVEQNSIVRFNSGSYNELRLYWQELTCEWGCTIRCIVERQRKDWNPGPFLSNNNNANFKM